MGHIEQKRMIFAFGEKIFFLLVPIVILAFFIINQQKIYVQIKFDKAPNTAIAQLFFDTGKDFNEDESYVTSLNKKMTTFTISPRFSSCKRIRIDPICEKEDFSIVSISVYGATGEKYIVEKEKLITAFKTVNCISSYDAKKKTLVINPVNTDPILIMSKSETGAFRSGIREIIKQGMENNLKHYIIDVLMVVFLCQLLYKKSWKIISFKGNSHLPLNVLLLLLAIVILIAHQTIYPFHIEAGAGKLKNVCMFSSLLSAATLQGYEDINIIAFFLVTQFLFLVLFQNKIGVILAYCSYILSIAEFFNMKILKSHISYITVNSLDFTVIWKAKDVVPQCFWGVIFLTIVYSCLIILAYRKKDLLKWYIEQRKFAILYLLLIFSSFCPATFIAYKNYARDFYKINIGKQMTVSECYSKMNSSQAFIPLNDVEAEPGKNIVIIYCESLEKGYIYNNDLSKDMTQVEQLLAENKNWTFYENYKCLPGSGCTIAALYATQTGLPMSFPINQNEVFDKKENSRTMFPSYAGVLAKAGYNNVFLTGCDLDFAGTGYMMRGFGYQCMGAESFENIVNTDRTWWGMHDLNLFIKAKKEYKKLISKGSPFNLTVLTIDTHFPKGFHDSRMKKHIGESFDFNSIDFTIASLDWLLVDFIKFVKSEDKSGNTAILILGDHLIMGNEELTPVVKRLSTGERRIFLLSNKSIKNDVHDEIGFYDIPNIVLDLAEVKTNVKFGKKLFPDMSPQFLEDNMDLLTILNLKGNKLAF